MLAPQRSFGNAPCYPSIFPLGTLSLNLGISHRLQNKGSELQRSTGVAGFVFLGGPAFRHAVPSPLAPPARRQHRRAERRPQQLASGCQCSASTTSSATPAGHVPPPRGRCRGSVSATPAIRRCAGPAGRLLLYLCKLAPFSSASPSGSEYCHRPPEQGQTLRNRLLSLPKERGLESGIREDTARPLRSLETTVLITTGRRLHSETTGKHAGREPGCSRPCGHRGKRAAQRKGTAATQGRGGAGCVYPQRGSGAAIPGPSSAPSRSGTAAGTGRPAAAGHVAAPGGNLPQYSKEALGRA